MMTLVMDDDAGLIQVCHYCGTPWMTESKLYNDGCCARDQMAQDRRECPEGE